MKQLPRVYYGLHFCSGVAQYNPPEAESFRIFLNEDTIRKMNPTFKGVPVFVDHRNSVSLEGLEAEADGYVIKSFFNESDGKTWAQFMITSDKGHEAIAKGWRLSNAYIPSEFANGGQWNGVDYAKEITGGRFTHMAIVEEPRYAESIILDEDAFKKYNESKLSELKRVQNSKEKKMGFFTKKQVENASEFEGALVTLKNGKDVSIKELVELVNSFPAAADKKDEPEEGAKEEKKNDGEDGQQEKSEPVMANGEHSVKLGDESMTVNELVSRHMAMKNAMMGVKEEKPGPAAPAANEQEKKEPKMENSLEKPTTTFETVANAADKAAAPQGKVVEFGTDRAARGKSRYGSSE